jgi:peptidoglycan hydrolase CwlO-like protein
LTGITKFLPTDAAETLRVLTANNQKRYSISVKGRKQILYSNLKTKLIKIACSAAAASLMFAPAAMADQFSDQISQLQAQINQQQAQASALQSQANTLSNQVAGLNAQIAATDAQIELTQAKYDKLQADIDAANQQLEAKKQILAENIRTIYQQSSITPLEMLASSHSFSDFVDRQQYLDRIKDHVQDAASAIVLLQQQLEHQKADAASLIKQQQDLKISLSVQQAGVNQLLSETQGQESAYQSMVADTKNKLSAVISARQAAVRSGNLQVSGGGCGDYPDRWCNAGQDSMVTDGSYYNRECVSYAAYYRESHGYGLPSGWGNAYQWAAHENASSPSPGDVAVWGAYANAWVGGFGHVAIVQSVDGGGISVSQYNFDVGNGEGRYSVMRIPYGSTMWGGIGFVH